MANDPEITEDIERPLKALANSDLVAEIKTRIVNGELKEALLFDTDTGRMYSDLGKEERRLFPPDAVVSLVFPMLEFDRDSSRHQKLADLLFDLSDEDFSALKSAVAAETEEGMRRLVAHLERLCPDETSGTKSETEHSDD